jgi:ribokinase
MKAKICVVGSINIDLVARGARIPRPGETVVGKEFMTVPGGKGANQAVAVARLGANVIMVGRVGEDAFAEVLLSNLALNQVIMANIPRTKNISSGVALIMVDDQAQNSILVVPGANALVSPEDVRLVESQIASADILLLQLEIPIETVVEAASIARRHGVKVILNPAPAANLPQQLWPLVDILIPNEHEASFLADLPENDENHYQAITDRLSRLEIKTLIITLGAKGALLVDAGKRILIPPFKVTAVDTTAAGDAFVGGFAVALAEGRSLEEAVRWGNASGALAATKMGAQPSLPGRHAVEDLVNTAGA